MSHDHVHMAPEIKDKRVAIAIWANGILTLAQIGGGIFAGSLALIADALHNFSDMASLVIAFLAQKIARRPADARMTFGYGRIEIVAALINYTTLIIIGFYLIYEGGMRIIDPPEVKGWWVAWRYRSGRGRLDSVAYLFDAERQHQYPRTVSSQSVGCTGVGRRGHWRNPYFTLRHALG